MLNTYWWGLLMGVMMMCCMVSAAMHDIFLMVGSACGMLICWMHLSR